MNSACRSLYWMIVAGLLFCNWEIPKSSFGRQFTKNYYDEHKEFRVKREGQNNYGIDGDGGEEDGGEQDGDEVDGDRDNGGGDCIPPPNPSAPVGLRGYRRYFANDSLIGRPVPCTRDDKVCFRHNLIFDPVTDRCKPLWEICGDGKTVTVVNRTELDHGYGRVTSSCSESLWKCPGYLLAYDGLCYREELVRDVICGPHATLTRHILGGVECRVEPITPISMQQPEEDGYCAIPDFHNPDPRHSMLLDELFQYEFSKELKCRSNQGVCFSKGNILVSGYDGCHTLLKRGPCAEDHIVALDLHAASVGRAEGTCVHVRGGCPKGYKRMLFDGECHEDRAIQIETPGKIVLDEFGRYFVSYWSTREFSFNLAFDGYQSCKVQRTPMSLVPPAAPALPTNPFSPPCGTDNSGKCKLYEVESTPPIPII